MGIESILQRCQKLYDDLALTGVRAWKAAQPGRKAVGFMPIYVPREIVHAAGILPVGLMGGDMEIIRGDAYYQSYICHIPRSTIELAVSGRLDCLDGMIFPSVCDVIRNLSGMWQLMFPDKYARYLDLPQNYAPGIGGAFYQEELRTLLNDMQRISGVAATNARLLDSIRLYNENRALVQGLYDLRADQPWSVPTSELYLLLRAGNVLPVEEHSALLREYRATVEAMDRPQLDNSRIVLTGAFCEQPPLGLLEVIEGAGCIVKDDDMVIGWRLFPEDVRANGDPLAALADAYLAGKVYTSVRHDRDRPRTEGLMQRIKQAGAEAVLFTPAKFCEPALLDYVLFRRRLEEAGTPHLKVEFEEKMWTFETTRTEVETFAESMLFD